MNNKQLDKLAQDLDALVGRRIQLTVQHSIRGHKPDPMTFIGTLLVVARKAGHDMHHSAKFTSPLGAVIQSDEGRAVFATLRNIADFKEL